MRALFAFAFIAIVLLVISCGSGPAVNNAASSPTPVNVASGERQPVLVELFTSEGCGNCPPADRQLAFLESQQPVPGADVITLGYHVDYFNDRGWKDKYSDAQYTKRQQLYSMRLGVESIYTPQMIVNGQAQFVGSDARKANDAIKRAASGEKPVVNVTVDDKTADVVVTGLTRHMVATAILATAEDGLVSDVKAGNNKGKRLPHVSVVRKLLAFGKVPGEAGEFRGAVELPTDPAWKQANVRYVFYLQEDQSGRIIAAGRVKAS
ncbi:MAG: DUF1223 domain-containing protein [Pyrinomonadaceae bacterium]